MNTKPTTTDQIQALADAETAMAEELRAFTARGIARAQALPAEPLVVPGPDGEPVVAPVPPQAEPEVAVVRVQRAERVWLASVLRLGVARKAWRDAVAAAAARSFTRLMASLRIGKHGRQRRRQRRAARKPTADPPAGSGDGPSETTKARLVRVNAPTGPPKNSSRRWRPFPTNLDLVQTVQNAPPTAAQN